MPLYLPIVVPHGMGFRPAKLTVQPTTPVTIATAELAQMGLMICSKPSSTSTAANMAGRLVLKAGGSVTES